MVNDLQLHDPFWTSGLVNQMEEFWGRHTELDGLAANIKRGGIAINGPVGIGKSSLLSIMRLMLQGFNTDLNSISSLAMCNQGNQPWQLAHKLWRHFRKTNLKRTKESGVEFFGIGWKQTTQDADLVEDDYIAAVAELLIELSDRNEFDYIVLFFDECHKCPDSLAELIRELKEHLEHEGVSKLRFITAGIGPYVKRMVQHDSGIGRAFPNRFELTPWDEETTMDFVSQKLEEVMRQAKEREFALEVDLAGSTEDTLDRIFYRLSGGHPFLTQLLGSYLIRHENTNSDQLLDCRDLVGGMAEICQRTRDLEYCEMIDSLETAGMLDDYKSMITSLNRKGPSYITKGTLDRVMSEDSLDWLLNNEFIFPFQGGFQLTDELLRVKLELQDNPNSASEEEEEIWGSEEADDEFEEF